MKLLKRILFWAGIGLLALILLCITSLGLFIGWMKWSGDRDWNRVQAELQAKGEKLTFEELVPSPPLDSENFYADPMWQELTDLVLSNSENFYNFPTWNPRIPPNQLLLNHWKKPLTPSEIEKLHALFPDSSITSDTDRKYELSDLAEKLNKTDNVERRRKIAQLTLDLMQPASTILSRISELTSRPSAYFPVRYQNGFIAGLPHLSYLMSMSRLLAWRSAAELELGNIPACATDTLTIIRLSSVEDSEPLLISSLVQISILGLGLTEVNAGIKQHRWMESDLVNFQEILRKKNLYGRLTSSLSGERASFYKTAHLKDWSGHRILPFLVKLDLQYCEGDYFTQTQHRIDAVKSASQGINESTLPASKGLSWYSHPTIKNALHALENLALPAINGAIEKTVQIQTQLSQTLIACALERYRLAHGSYPGSLDLLVPEYLPSIPNEPTTGNPMHYGFQSDGTFLLWAPDWKLKTLNGKTGEHSGEGDIVWNQPIPRS